MKQPKQTDDTQRVADFNRTMPIGTRVTLILDNGEEFITATRSEAWLLGHGQGVVAVEGKSGGWALDRVKLRLSAVAFRIKPAYGVTEAMCEEHACGWSNKEIAKDTTPLYPKARLFAHAREAHQLDASAIEVTSEVICPRMTFIKVTK